MRAITFALCAALLIGLSGCVTKDQVVELSPKVPGERGQLSDAGRVALDVVDRRGQIPLGHIANLGGTSAKITTARGLPYTVQLAAAEALRDYGFKPTLWSDDAEPRLLIEITGIDHQVGAAVPRAVRTDVSLSAQAWNQGQRYTSQAETSLDDTFGRPATAAANADLIDRALGRALGKLLNEELAEFLAGPRGPVTQGITE